MGVLLSRVETSGPWPLRLTIALPDLRQEWPLAVSRSYYLGPFKVKTEPDFSQACLEHGAAQTSLVFGVEEQEASAAGANQLAGEGAIRQRQSVPGVDLTIAHVRRALLLVLPVFRHQRSKLPEISCLQSLLTLQTELL